MLTTKSKSDTLDHVATASIPELKALLDSNDTHLEHELQVCAKTLAELQFGRRIYLRGLIEISNVCRNDCYYCGIRSGNERITRYRLTADEVMSACERGYEIGFRTFVLQGGEDPYWRGERLVSLVRNIRTSYPECAITLSLGEMEYVEYEALFRAGANRYLLRHETYDKEHYESLHPSTMDQEHRLQALRDLKQIGYQVGTGVMIGSPGQTTAHLAQDLDFIHRLQPAMIGVGPFIPHEDTPLGTYPAGSLSMTLRFLALCRLLNPRALIPATTAVATLHPEGRLAAIRSGCNVVMPNLSPLNHRADYALYNNKAYSGSEAAEGVALLQAQLDTIGYQIDWGRGDAPAS